MVGVVEKVVVVGVVEKVVGGGEGGCVKAVVRLVQNNDSKRKYYLKDHSPVTRIIPFRHRWGNLSEHTLIDTTDLWEP